MSTTAHPLNSESSESTAGSLTGRIVPQNLSRAGDSALSRRIEQCREQGRPALVGYLPAGYPTVAESVEAAVALGRNGADVIEIGIPYSDPVMDGPVIQAATTESLANGFRVSDVFTVVRAVAEQTDAVPVVMTYWNPVLQTGVDEFARRLSEAGERGSSPRT